LTENEENVTILGVHRQKLNQQVAVYNFTVGDAGDESFHTYFVGYDNVLVHNTCSNVNNNSDASKVDDLVNNKTQGYQSKTTEFTNDSVHGNSLKTQKKTELYKLVDNENFEIRKIGETTRGLKRYSGKYYIDNGVQMQHLSEGTKLEMKVLEHSILSEIKEKFPEYFAEMLNKCLH
jgi:hypothetical protein